MPSQMKINLNNLTNLSIFREMRTEIHQQTTHVDNFSNGFDPIFGYYLENKKYVPWLDVILFVA